MTFIALIPLFPLIGFLINGLGFGKISKTAVPLIGTGASLLSFACVLLSYLNFKETAIIVNLFDWISIAGFKVGFSFQLDQLSIIMLFVITGVGTLIHLYSAGYMSHDEGYGKFFAYLNLFLFSMILLVLGGNYLMMFIGWEGVGLCSYLLIGFWFRNINYSNAANKAFIMNRIGDLGFLMGLALIYKTLQEAKDIFKIKSASRTIEFVVNTFKKHPEFTLEYFEIAEEETLLRTKRKDKRKKYRGFIAVFIGNIRLIDNISLN